MGNILNSYSKLFRLRVEEFKEDLVFETQGLDVKQHQFLKQRGAVVNTKNTQVLCTVTGKGKGKMW